MAFYNQIILFAVFYVGLVLVLTFAGSKRKIGGESLFFISLILTPIVGVLFLLTSKPNVREIKHKYFTCKHCGFALSEKKQFCPICDKDEEGKTLIEYKKEYKAKETEKPQQAVSEKPKIEIDQKYFNQN